MGLASASSRRDSVAPAFALVTQRADLRTFPTALRVFGTPGDTDIDRFQESALFPGTPVAVLHRSRDGAWSFVASPLYRAWIRSRLLAFGERAEVLGYAAREPYLVVTGATARTVFTREQPQVSELQLDMGVRVPLRADWPADVPVNGQHPLSSYVIELPIRAAEFTRHLPRPLQRLGRRRLPLGDQQVDDDPVDPRRDPRFAAKRGQPAVDAHEHVLGHFLRASRISDAPRDQREHQAFVSFDQLAKRLFIALSASLDELPLRGRIHSRVH